MILYSNNIVEYQGNIINFTPPPIYHVYTSGNYGVVNAIPTSGISGTEVTLTNTAETGYIFDSYSVSGATLKNANQFDIVNFEMISLPPIKAATTSITASVPIICANIPVIVCPHFIFLSNNNYNNYSNKKLLADKKSNAKCHNNHLL